MARQQPSMEEEIAQTLKTVERMPPHAAREFEDQRGAIDYAPPSVREDMPGNGPDLPASRVKVVERGLIELQQSHADRDRLMRERQSLRARIVELETILSARSDQEHVIAERVNQCLADRDHAVKEAGEHLGVLSALAAVLFKYLRPVQPPEDQYGPDQDKPNE